MWLVASVVFCLDSCIKTYLRLYFAYQSIPVIRNIFHITVIFNKGAAFGILQKSGTMLVYIGILFLLIFSVFIKKEKKKNLLFLISCGMILGGAFSNLWDRIFLGFVVDYIDLRVWPVFNLSDSCITVGVALLILEPYLGGFRKEHAPLNSKAKQT